MKRVRPSLHWALAIVMVACSSSTEEDGTTTSASTTGSTASTGASTTTSSSASTAASGGAGGESSSGGGGQGGAGGMACQWSPTNPCPSGFYCDAPGCTMGTCVPLGTVDDPNKQPVCGCDDVNYWNAATAAVHGMAVASSGECPVPAWCGGFATLPCPDNTKHACAYLYTTEAECNISDGSGICWGMPATCSQLGVGGAWRACFGNPADPCLYECDAIKTQSPHWNDTSGCPM